MNHNIFRYTFAFAHGTHLVGVKSHAADWSDALTHEPFMILDCAQVVS